MKSYSSSSSFADALLAIFLLLIFSCFISLSLSASPDLLSSNYGSAISNNYEGANKQIIPKTNKQPLQIHQEKEELDSNLFLSSSSSSSSSQYPSQHLTARQKKEEQENYYYSDSYQNSIFVDGIAGNDSSDCGFSPQNPCQSIFQAISLSNSSFSTILIK